MDGYSQAPETESWRLESILSCSPPTRLLKNAKESCFLMHPTGPFSPSGDSFTFRGYLQSFIDLYLLNITLAFLIHLNGVFSKVLNDFSFFLNDFHKLVLCFSWRETPLPLTQGPRQRPGRSVSSLSPSLPICTHVWPSALVSVYLGIIKFLVSVSAFPMRPDSFIHSTKAERIWILDLNTV